MPSTTTSRFSDRKRDAARAMGRMSRAIGGVDRIRSVPMSSNNSKLGSTRSRTIFEKRNGAYVVARDEGNVTRIRWLHVVKGDPLKNFIAEPDRARDVFDAEITDVATITDGGDRRRGHDHRRGRGRRRATIANFATVTNVATITEVIEDLPGLRNDITNYDWSMKRVLKAALER